MKKLTHQQIFDRAVRGVVAQGELSGTHGSCKYRMRKGGKVLRCGVGQLIEPDLYSPAIEHQPVGDAFPVADWADTRAQLGLALMFSGVDTTDSETLELLLEIQAAHDCASGIEAFIGSARRVAFDNGLKFPRLSA